MRQKELEKIDAFGYELSLMDENGRLVVLACEQGVVGYAEVERKGKGFALKNIEGVFEDMDDESKDWICGKYFGKKIREHYDSIQRKNQAD